MKKQLLLITIALVSTFRTNAQIVTIPDANFKASLLANSNINTNADTEIQVSEAQAYNFPMYVSGLNIADLTGIEAFTSLTNLNCSSNLLTSIDLSSNTALTDLYCNNNQLTDLNISNNPSLSIVHCHVNAIATLNLSNNPNLVELSCDFNPLGGLDISQQTLLARLYCNTCGLSALDLSNNPALTELGCSANSISTLNLNNNTNLEILACQANQISSLNLSNNPNLTSVYCFSNQLTGIDLSDNGDLMILMCHGNQLTSLNVANGNNTVITNNNFRIDSNPDLTCVTVDDVAFSNSNWTAWVDAQTTFSTDCSGTASLSEINPKTEMSIYPNPVNSETIIYLNTIAKNSEAIPAKIVTSTGVVIQSLMLNPAENAIDLSQLTSGVYFIEAANGSAYKFIKQ